MRERDDDREIRRESQTTRERRRESQTTRERRRQRETTRERDAKSNDRDAASFIRSIRDEEIAGGIVEKR